MFLDLDRKAADMSEENENLKKEKELAMEEYESLKQRNDFLKALLAETKKARMQDHMHQVSKKFHAKKSNLVTSTPFSCRNHLSIVPYLWPPIFPPPADLNRASHSNDTSPSQFPMFLYPVPWLRPILTHSNIPHSHCSSKSTGNAHHCCACSCPGTSLHENRSHMSTGRSMWEGEASSSMRSMTAGGVHGLRLGYPSDCTTCVPVLFTRVKPEEHGPMRNDVRVGLSCKSRELVINPHKEREDNIAASEARRKRKELMKMKNVLFRHQG